MINDNQYQTIFDLAHRAGLNAASNVKPTVPTMHGSAWIIIEGNTDFSLWTKKKKLSRQGTERGREISSSKLVADHLSYKEAYVNAFSKVLKDYGIKASVKSRLD